MEESPTVTWRFRKSFRIVPGVRLNVSSRGVSATIGGGPLSLNVGAHGTAVNATLPGTGISVRHRLAGGGANASLDDVPSSPGPIPSQANRVEIQSASTYELSSDALAELQRILAHASREQQELDTALASAEPNASTKNEQLDRWRNGLIFRHVFKKRFLAITSEAEEASALLAELREQRRLALVATHIDVSDVLRRPFGRLCDAFSRLAECQKIWDTLAIQKTDRFRERTTAVHSIERKSVRFALGASDLLICEWKVPKLANANGGDLYLYPGFVLYRVSRQSFAVIDAREVSLRFSSTRFIEEEGVPPDSEIVGQTWKKANKDGTPDRRFAANYQIPIVKYAEVAFTTASGLNEAYLISNYAAAEGFAGAWDAYRATFETQTQTSPI
jgi:hypothetical protein